MRATHGLLLWLAACAPSADAPHDTDTPDDRDTDVLDTVVVDSGSADSDVVDTVVVDSDTDTDVGGCSPIALEEVMALCGGKPTIVSHLADPEHAGCGDWWQAGVARGATVGEALDAAACDRTCVYRPHRSVMVLYCGLRSEYFEWTAGASGQVGAGDGCADWVDGQTQQGSGWFPTWEAYQEAFPCPADTDTDVP